MGKLRRYDFNQYSVLLDDEHAVLTLATEDSLESWILKRHPSDGPMFYSWDDGPMRWVLWIVNDGNYVSIRSHNEMAMYLDRVEVEFGEEWMFYDILKRGFDYTNYDFLVDHEENIYG